MSKSSKTWLIINHGCFKLAGQWFTRNIIPSDHSRNGSLPYATSWLLWEGLFHVYWSIKWSTADWKICFFLKRTKSTDPSFAVNLVTPEEFRLEISYIPNNKSHGLYLCPTQIFKSYKWHSGEYSKYIYFNWSLSLWAMAKIIPIFKQDDNTDINNYRPIVLLL